MNAHRRLAAILYRSADRLDTIGERASSAASPDPRRAARSRALFRRASAARHNAEAFRL